MAYVITRNYRDSEYALNYRPWLVREESQTVSEARSVSALAALNVRFCESTIEAGFGCYVVAIADAVEIYNEGELQHQGYRRLEFVRHLRRFHFQDDSDSLSRVQSLVLDADRSMWAEPMPA